MVDGEGEGLEGWVLCDREAEGVEWWKCVVQTYQYRSELWYRVQVLLGRGVEVYGTSTRPREDKGEPKV